MAEQKKRVLFICSFSSKVIRDRLKLKSWHLRNTLLRIVNHPCFVYSDKGVWVSDFINEFERHPEFDYHILATHKGLTSRLQDFDINGISYHFLKSDFTLLGDTLNALFKAEEHSDYHRNRRLMLRVIEKVNPDIVVVCGVENPEYSSVVLDIKNRPVYVLLQTVLNNPKLLKYTNEARGYRAELERRIFLNVNYFGTGIYDYYSLFHSINPKAICLSVNFPSHKPSQVFHHSKEYDFVFFGRMTKNKGVEDIIKAMGSLIKYHPEARLCIIGSTESDYTDNLRCLADEVGVLNNLIFVPRFKLLDDLYNEVQKSRFALLPGITAFNSTVRESMLMGLPTIVYDMPLVREINADKVSLLAAHMEDIDDLASKMRFAIEHPETMAEIGTNGKDYAENAFSNFTIGNRLTANLRAIIDHYYKGIDIPDSQLLTKELR